MSYEVSLGRDPEADFSSEAKELASHGWVPVNDVAESINVGLWVWRDVEPTTGILYEQGPNAQKVLRLAPWEGQHTITTSPYLYLLAKPLPIILSRSEAGRAVPVWNYKGKNKK